MRTAIISENAIDHSHFGPNLNIKKVAIGTTINPIIESDEAVCAIPCDRPRINTT